MSYQTVSRVINDAEHVSARTREKVQQAMAELHYVPNRGAQQLAGKRTRTLGLITTDLALHAPSQIVSAVKSRAVERGERTDLNGGTSATVPGRASGAAGAARGSPAGERAA